MSGVCLGGGRDLSSIKEVGEQGQVRFLNRHLVTAALGPRRDILLTIDNVPTSDLRVPAP